MKHIGRPFTHFDFSKVSIEDFFWMVGILEGEGCFAWSSSGRKYWPKITVNMTDEDIIAKFAGFIDRKYFRRPARPPSIKDCYVTSVVGTPAAELMEKLFPYMGRRRQTKIQEILNKFKPS